MKKILLILLLLITPLTVNAESHYLYDVLKDEAESNGLAKEYTREHHDSFTKEATHKIYHWYATTAEEGNQINEKNNIVLGDYCWKIIRTTDTGGIKVLYNGEVTNGKCLGTNVSIGNTNYALYDNLYYIGSSGYMHNELYSKAQYSRINFGNINQTGNKIDQNEYTVVDNSVSDKTCKPYIFNSSNEWELNTSCLESHNNTKIILKVNAEGDYILNYSFRPDWDIDSLSIYKNNELINRIGINNSSSIVLNSLKTTDEIRIEFDPYKSDDDRSELTFSINKPVGEITDTRYYFGNDVTYSNGVYTLKEYSKNNGYGILSNTHYFCENGSLSCENVRYIINWNEDLGVTYLELSNGKKIEDLVNDQLYGENKNKLNSPVKDLIDTWYETNLKDYTKYFEDTIFCQKMMPLNNKSFINKDGGRGEIVFVKDYSYDNSESEDYLYDSNLKCDHENGMYSMSNPRAKLKYPIAPMSFAEALLLSNGTYEHNGGNVLKFKEETGFFSYWLLTTNYTGSINYGLCIYSRGGPSYRYGADTISVVPMVSLKSEVTYLSGDGSATNPYVINPNLKHKVDVLIKNETKDFEINLNDLTQVEEGTKVDFKLTPIKGHKITSIKIVDEDNNELEYETDDNKNYTFTMPYSNVTIIPSYERVKNAVNVEDNKNTKEFVIEVNDSKAVVYEDTVKFRVEPEAGYEVEKIDITDKENNKINYKKTNNINEYEFIMPDTDVLIKPYYRLISSSNLPNPNTKRQIILILISVLVLGIMAIIFVKKKKRLN